MTTPATKQTAVGWTLGIVIFAVGVAAWAGAAAVQRPGSPKAMPPSRLFEGSIAEIQGSAVPSRLSLVHSDGSTLQVVVDPVETVVLQGGRVTEAGNLEKGQQVKTRYATQDGKEVARSIEITDPLPMPATAAPTAPETAPQKSAAGI